MEAYERIKKSIIEGAYAPGTRLTEENLAKELQISRTPIREAIKRLETERLISPLKRGVIVSEFNTEDIRQIYNLRALLEGYAAAEAAVNRSDEDIEAMERCNEQFKDLLETPTYERTERLNEIMELNNQFHSAVYNASHNEHLRFHISSVTVLPLVFRSFYWYNEYQLKKSLELHQTISVAIQANEPDRAKTAMQEHIYQGRDHVLKNIDHES
ncbi:FCD domain-containing protein [Halobacillus litoralis]|uniref:FCD domain-containing protein n=1 Tax=Halobacillus litoralis TaxID=45668 RepID=A0A845FBF8_9BACI|nr:GntR family transcriptional regulator [Halobacillus litoralis]MYL71673.1 FCD domain-containing protein [Halobacillus litoralis]